MTDSSKDRPSSHEAHDPAVPTEKATVAEGVSQARFQIGFQLLLFALVLALTLVGSNASSAHLTTVFPVTSIGGTVWFFFAAFAATTAILLVLVRVVRHKAFFTALFVIAVFSGLGTITALLIGSASAVLVTSVSVFAYYGARRIWVHDVILALGIAGIAVIVGGGTSAIAIVVILSALAFYDIIAVYGTKHMISMGKDLMRLGATFVFLIPERPKELLMHMSTLTSDRRRCVFLGTGDIVLPALLVASVARYDAYGAIAPAVGALIGLWVSMRLFLTDGERRPMPALPPVALGAILGYVVILLL